MDKIIKTLGIDEEFTKPLKKEKKFTKVYDNVPHIEHYNYMMDLLELPITKDKYKYLLVVVDLGNNEFDIEPIKNKQSKTILQAFQNMFKRPYIKKPYASVRTDGGGEFKGEFSQWLYKNNILHRTALPYRHSQLSSVENLNRTLGRFLNGYMNSIEKKTGEPYNEWTDILKDVRKLYNIHRRKKNGNPFTQDVTFSKELAKEPKFKVGDVVYYKTEYPLNALGKKQPTAKFRQGDYRYNIEPRKIEEIFIYPGDVPYRYKLEGLNNVSYPDTQLKLSNEKETKYIVKDIIGKRNHNKQIQYLVWFKGELKKNASWQNKKDLVSDGLQDYINRYEQEIKKK